jgi:hypothetical protein
MATLWIDVHHQTTDAKLGDGPIITATEWSYSPVLDGAGTFAFTMPAGDPRAALLESKRVVRAWMEDDGAIRQVGAGIIDAVALDVADPSTLHVSGPDLMAELLGRIIPELAVCEQGWVYLNAGHGSVRRVPNLRNKVEEDLPEAYDGNAGTATAEFEIRDDWWLYVGYDTRFDRIRVDLATVNGTFTATPQYQYFSSAQSWDALSGVSDGTIVSGRPFAQDGDITFTRPADWERSEPTEASGSWFWVRIRREPDVGNNFTISLNEIQVYADVPTTNGVNLIMAYAPATWTQSGYPATATGKYLEVRNESVLAALRSLSEQGGQEDDAPIREHFRLKTTREIDWFSTFTDCGLRAVSADGAEAADDLCLIQGLRQERDTAEVVTRIYPLSNDGLGLELTTRVPPTGYTLSAVNNYLEYDAGVAALGRIEAAARFTDISCQENDSWYLHPAYVANAVYDRALEYLRTHAAEQYFYNLDLVKVRAEIEPGDTIAVSYHEYRDGYHAVNIDATLYVLGARTQVDQQGLHTVGLEVSTVDRAAQSDAGVIGSTIQDVRRVVGAGAETRVLLGATGIANPVPGADISINGWTISRAGNRVLLFGGDGAPVAEYLGDASGMAAALTAALAAATTGDVIQCPAGTIAGDHTVGAGVEVVGRGRANTILSGQITLGDGAVLRDLAVTRTASQAGDLIGIVAPASGMAYVIGCDIAVNNATGDGFPVQLQDGDIALRWCSLSAQSGGVDADPFGRGDASVVVESAVDIGVKVLSLWNGASNDAPPADWETAEYDDSAWGAAVEATDPYEWYATPLWDSATPSPSNEECLFRHAFTLPAGTTQVRMRANFNNGSQGYYLNGTLLGTVAENPGIAPGNGWQIIDPGVWVAGATNTLALRCKDAGGPVACCVWEVEITASDTGTPYVMACVIPNGNGCAAAIPEWGDRASWRTDVDSGATHADDWAAGDSHHAAATLAASAEELLGLSGQELSLDAQAANTVLAGPASGADAAPTFRALVAGDVPALADHDHSGDAGDGGTFDAANLTSGAATDGQVLTADGAGAAAWEDVAGGGDVTWAIIQASQLVNEFKGFPSSVGIDIDLDAANQWWDKHETPSTAVTMVDVAGEAGLTETYEFALKTVTDGVSEGLSQTWTYADEPRVKAGRTLSVICAIWSVDSLAVTATLLNSDASKTSAGAVTAAAWTIVKIEGHTLAGTSCQFIVEAGQDTGTFYVVPLGACIGAKAVPLASRRLKYIDKKVDNLVENVDAGGNWTDLDLTASTGALACKAHLSCRYSNSSNANKALVLRRNGDAAATSGHTVARNQSTTGIAQNQASVLLDDAQICEFAGAAAGDTEAIYIHLAGYWEWE